MIKKLLSAAAACCALMSSCDTGSLLPNITGQSYDLLVVGDEKTWRDSSEMLPELLSEDIPTFVQSEPYFTVSYVKESDFSGILRPVRNMLFYEINPQKYTFAKVVYSRERWAQTQAIATITAPDRASFDTLVVKKIDEIRNFFIGAECGRAFSFYGSHRNQQAIDSIKRHYNANVLIPNHLTLSKFGENFDWYSDGKVNMRQDIVVYRHPYTSEYNFLPEHLLKVRDSVLKANVPGPTPGSYMTTDYKYIPPISTAVTSPDGKYSVKIHGHWRVEGDAMGGQFVSQTYLDKDNRNLITVEAWVYAPNQKKRTVYRQLEGLISNVTFGDPNSKEEKKK